MQVASIKMKHVYNSINPIMELIKSIFLSNMTVIMRRLASNQVIWKIISGQINGTTAKRTLHYNWIAMQTLKDWTVFFA
jgi:hypothetical protein